MLLQTGALSSMESNEEKEIEKTASFKQFCRFETVGFELNCDKVSHVTDRNDERCTATGSPFGRCGPEIVPVHLNFSPLFDFPKSRSSVGSNMQSLRWGKYPIALCIIYALS